MRVGGAQGRARLAATLARGWRIATVAAVVLVLAGCVPIGVRVQNMFAALLP